MVRKHLNGFVAPWTSDLSYTHGCHWTTDASYRYCMKIVRDSDPNLSLWMHLIPKKQAKALAAVYAVARIADDLTDENQFGSMRRDALSAWLDTFERACMEDANHPAMVALADSMKHFNMDAGLVRKYLLSCMDESNPIRFDTWEHVENFARDSFGSLGKIVMCVMGLDRTELQYWAERMSIAVFITCRLRDLSVDLPKGRVFLPLEHLERYGMKVQDLLTIPPAKPFGAVLESAVEHTRWIYREAYPLVMEAGGYATALLAGLWLGGRSLLRLVDRTGTGLYQTRPALSVFVFVRTMMGAGLERIPEVLT